tara:strand:- start:96 stop:965 length:870 start_codon:yes stop_codon:yes gene_type:complete
MATFTPTLTLTTLGLTSNDLNFTVATSPTVTDTTGLQRKTLTSVSKTNRITCVDGDADVAAALAHQGQFIDVTDNHGLKRRYVFIDGSNSSVATGSIIATGTDIGSDTPANLGLLELVGGIALDVTDGMQQRDYIAELRTGINHANGHNGSITAAAVASEADGPQSTTLTNPTAGEGAAFLVDTTNSTITVFLDATEDALATNSAADHPVIVDKNEFASPAFLYIKNTAAYHASDGRVFCYYDNHGAEDIMEIRGGHFAFVPLSPNNNLKAYTSTSGTIVEYMVIGDDA